MSKKLFYLLGAVLIFSLAPYSAFAGHDHDRDQGQGHGQGRGHNKHDRDDDDRDDRKAERHYYREHDRELHEWYEGHRGNLPPGLAKRDELPPGLQRQLAVRGTLPPGLQKKMRPCPVEVEQVLPPPPPGYIHTVIGGNVVLVNRKTFFVLDIFHF
jgi:Ni/Co efflux regulator RcnB